jgi:Trypsin
LIPAIRRLDKVTTRCFSIASDIFLGFDERIINGTEVAGIEKYPFQVQVYNIHNIEKFCGGVILSEYYVLTAAQCTHDEKKEDTKVLVGHNIIYKGATYHIADFFEHPKYEDKGEWKNFDVSVVKLKTGLKFSKGVQTIQLPASGQKFGEGLRCRVLGFGLSANDHQFDYDRPLKVADTKIVSHKDCAAIYESRWRIRNWMLCAGNGLSEVIRGPCNVSYPMLMLANEINRFFSRVMLVELWFAKMFLPESCHLVVMLTIAMLVINPMFTLI